MDAKERIAQCTAALEAALNQMGIEIRQNEQTGTIFLQFMVLIDDSLPEADGLVSMEMGFIDALPDYAVLEVYSTLIPSVTDPSVLEQAVERWNYTSNMGGYGIYAGDKSFYHKQMSALGSGMTTEAVVEQAKWTLAMCVVEIKRRLGAAILLSDGEMPFVQAQALGLC